MTDLIAINNFRELVDRKKAEILQSATIEIPLLVADMLINSYVREELLGETKTTRKRGPRGPYKKNTIKDTPPDNKEGKPKSELERLAETLKAAGAALPKHQLQEPEKKEESPQRPEWADVLDKQQGNRPRRSESGGSYV